MEQGVERVALVGMIDPDVTVASTVSTVWIAGNLAHQFFATVAAGTLGTSATLDAKLEQATDSGGTGVKDITGKAITQLTQAGTDSDKQALINLRTDELDVDGGFDYFRLSVTLAVATSDLAATVHAIDLRNGPASGVDLASVDETVN